MVCPSSNLDTVDLLAVLAWSLDDGSHVLCLPWGEGDTVGAKARRLHPRCTRAQGGAGKAPPIQALIVLNW